MSMAIGSLINPQHTVLSHVPPPLRFNSFPVPSPWPFQVALGKRANRTFRGALQRLGLPDPFLDFTVFPDFLP